MTLAQGVLRLQVPEGAHGGSGCPSMVSCAPWRTRGGRRGDRRDSFRYRERRHARATSHFGCGGRLVCSGPGHGEVRRHALERHSAAIWPRTSCAADKLPDQLRTCVQTLFGRKVRSGHRPPPRTRAAWPTSSHCSGTRAGHDFSLYKQSTIRRRIERRMTVHGLTEAEGLRTLPQGAPAGSRGPVQGTAHQRHQLLPRPGSIRHDEERSPAGTCRCPTRGPGHSGLG